MPPRDPTKVQLDFPALTADLIGQLQLVGPVGLLDFVPAVQPVFLIGSRGITFGSQLPVFKSSEVFSGFNDSPAANTIIIDTGQLVAGDYDITASLIATGAATVTGQLVLEHRNAANAANLAEMLVVGNKNGIAQSEVNTLPLIAYEIGTNERLRVKVDTNFTGVFVQATLFLRRRPAP